MRLIVVGSNSKGNCYALDAGDEILLLEAGMKYSVMSKAIGHQLNKVVGCLVTHRHGDHAKYVKSYMCSGIQVYGCKDIMDSIPPEDFEKVYKRWNLILPEQTLHLGNFDVVPFYNYHDVEIYGYLIRHKQMGTMLFSTDSYKVGLIITGVEHYLIEANYSDEQLKSNVLSGNITQSQADRVVLSHMSIDYCAKYLRDCEAWKSAKTITLCHLSARNSNPLPFRNLIAGAFGVPTFIAEKGAIINLDNI